MRERLGEREPFLVCVPQDGEEVAADPVRIALAAAGELDDRFQAEMVMLEQLVDASIQVVEGSAVGGKDAPDRQLADRTQRIEEVAERVVT